MKGRLISEYLENKIPNQGLLLDELENKEFEQEGKYILTIKSFGVPTTALYLLLYDGLKKIKDFQNSLKDGMDNEIKAISKTDLPVELDLIDPDNGINNWDMQHSKTVDHLTTASGSTAIGYCEWYYPHQNERIKPLYDLYRATPTNIEICRDYIRKISSAEEDDRKYLIHVFKDIISFFETAYALKDRIKFEKDKFTSLVNKPDEIQIPSDFNSICSKRGSIIHGSAFNFEISPENELKFGTQKIVPYLEKGLEAAEKWINSIYVNMLKELQKH